MIKKIHKAVIPAAGLGTRFLPATKALPKEMIPIIDKPTLQYIVEEAAASGITDILIILGRNKTAIENHFDIAYELESELIKKSETELLKLAQHSANLANIYYVRQKEPKGLGHAICCAESFIGNDHFAVLLGDNIIRSKVPCTKQLIDVYQKCESSVLGVQPVSSDDISKYGIISLHKDNNSKVTTSSIHKINDLIEKPLAKDAPSNMAILGRYIISPKIFDHLKNTSIDKRGEIGLTEALKSLLCEESIFAYNFEGILHDIGNKFGYIQAIVEFALNRDDLKDKFTTYLKEISKTL